MLKQEIINNILIDTFSKPLKVYQREFRKKSKNRDQLTLYQLKCMAYWLYSNCVGATYESVSAALGVPAHFVSSGISQIRKELYLLNKNINKK
jgi:hypothetical protein